MTSNLLWIDKKILIVGSIEIIHGPGDFSKGTAFIWKISYNYFIVENFSPQCIEVNDCHASVNMPDKTAP